MRTGERKSLCSVMVVTSCNLHGLPAWESILRMAIILCNGTVSFRRSNSGAAMQHRHDGTQVCDNMRGSKQLLKQGTPEIQLRTVTASLPLDLFDFKCTCRVSSSSSFKVRDDLRFTHWLSSITSSIITQSRWFSHDLHVKIYR